MFLSRVLIDQGAQAQIELFKSVLRDKYSIHQLVWKLFPNTPESKRDFLYRQEFESITNSDFSPRKGVPVFYTVSNRPPQSLHGFLKVDVKEYSPLLYKGDVLNFILRANPVVAKYREGKKNSVKHDIIMDAKSKAIKENLPEKNTSSFINDVAIDWLERICETYGFKVFRDQTNIMAYRRERIVQTKTNTPIKFSTVDFSGVIEVTNAEIFKNTLFYGIGRSKGFGCGLMLVKKR